MTSSAEFREKLGLLLIEKVLLGAILFVAGLWVKRAIENRAARAAEARAAMADQLRSFYAPLILRLEMDSVYTCGQIAALYQSDDVAALTRWRLVNDVVLPNHDSIKATLEQRGDLLATDSLLKANAQAFVHHAALYRVVARGETETGTPETFGAGWPQLLLPVLRYRDSVLTKRLQECDASTSRCDDPIDWRRRPSADSLLKLAGRCVPALSVAGLPKRGLTNR
jgi:hypothetical protein